MSILKRLVKIKKQDNTSNIVAMLDEVILYDKLAVSETFRDILNSPAAQKRLPLITMAMEDPAYGAVMLDTCCHVVRHLTGEGAYLTNLIPVHVNERQARQSEVLASTLSATVYCDMDYYHHDDMCDRVLAIYEHDRDDRTFIAMILAEKQRYRVVQGSYRTDEDGKQTVERPTDVLSSEYEIRHAELSAKFYSYSKQGNHGYVFATMKKENASRNIIMPYEDTIYLLDPTTDEVVHIIELDNIQTTTIALSLNTIDTFATTIMSIISEQFQ